MTDLSDLTENSADYYKQDRSEMIDFIPPTVRRVLDIGCGEGRFGLQLKQSGMKVWGVEMDTRSATVAQQYLDGVIIGDINNIVSNLPDNFYDCIVFNDVLEHLADPFTLLNRIKRKLCREGIVVSSIPNVRYFGNLKNLLIKKNWKYEDSGILDKTHLRFFTENSIRHLFDSLGYEIIRLRGINALKPRWKFKLLNFFLFGYLSDTKYLQFACVARLL